ncbi:MAG: serine hydrolase [Roseivirga sp.]|nr:serine hydrolase [Roseivirga sp.]
MRKLFFYLAFSSLFTFNAFCQTIGNDWTKASPATQGFIDKNFDELDDFIRNNASTTGLVVIVNGKMIYDYGNITQLSYLASCRKSVLSMLYGIYIDQGKIDLKKTLADLEIDDRQGLSDQEKTATIDNIINSSSGIYHPASNSGDNLADAPTRGSQKPGEYFLYSNWDFNAAGGIFEQETGIDIFDAVEKDIAGPIGMQDFKRNRQRKLGNLTRSKFPAYHMWFSTRDMARLGQLMLQKGKWNGKQIVPEAWVEKTTSVVTPIEKMNPAGMRQGEFGYAYMWWIWDGPKASGAFEGAYTARGAYGQYITVLPKLDMVVAHKTNPDDGSTRWGVYRQILERIVTAKK